MAATTTLRAVLRFTLAASNRLIDLVSERLHENGLIVVDRSPRLLVLTTHPSSLEDEAQAIHLLKRSRRGIVERYHTNDRDSFEPFTAAEQALLLFRLWTDIQVMAADEATSKLAQLLESEYHVDYGLPALSSSRRKVSMRDQSTCLRHILIAHGLAEPLQPVHDETTTESLLQATLWPWYRLDPPSDEIQNYYGWETGFYFAWMGFVTRWLAFPAIGGVAVSLWRWYRGDTLVEDEYTPFYGLVTFVWGILLIRFWDRYQCRLSHRWGTYALSEYERTKYFAARPEFHGIPRSSPVTGELEIYYPSWRRRLQYVASAAVTAAMLSVAFTVMILSLNLQGYIRPSSNPSRWTVESPHPFHVRSLAVYSEAGRVFDTQSSWRALCPVVLHVVCILTLNTIYRSIAERLTCWENHESEISHRNSLILKRFLFEAFDCYVALFYLAFYERDVDRLRLELVAVFQLDTFRRLATECLVPMVLRRWYHPAKKDGSAATPLEQLEEDLDKEEVDLFDDYMEIIIELGYVILFASAYPLASLISLVANWIEIRSDMFKTARLRRRPIPLRHSDIGMYQGLMKALVWSSALTNCLLAGVTSDQLMHYLPNFYLQDRTGYTTLEHDRGWLVMLVIFGLERFLLLGGLVILAIVPKVPEDVQDDIERWHFVQEKRERLALSTRRLLGAKKKDQ